MNRQALITGVISKPDYVKARLREMGFWFVDIPRTSSTAIRQALYLRYGKVFGKPSNSQGLGVGLVPPHTPAVRIREQIGAELWDSLQTFSVVRNPFERVLSLYRFLRHNGALKNVEFPAYVNKLVSGGFDYHGHSMSNWGYVSDGEGNQIVKEIFRYEDRESAMPLIAERTGCPELSGTQRQTYSTTGEPYAEFYDAASRRKIESHFSDDLARFDYQF